MKTRLFGRFVLLASLALLALLAPGAGWPAAAQSPQAASCPTSFEWGRQWGSTGSGPGQFQAPVAVAVDRDGNGNVHVVDRDNRRIQKFDPLGGYILEYGNKDGRVMVNPNGIEVGPRGYMYIADTGQHRILYYDTSGTEIGSWQDGDGGSQWRMFEPWGVAGWGEYPGPENVYVVDRLACQILRFSNAGSFIGKRGGSACSLFSAPQDVATYVNDPANIFLYIADTGNNQIAKYDYGLNPLFNWGAAGAANGQFNQPGSVATDANGCVYVADTGNHRIQVFDDQGGFVTFVTKFGSQGSGAGQLQGPRGVAVDQNNGYVYIADTGNNQVVVFRPDSTAPVVGSIPPSGGNLTSPTDQTSYTFPAGTFSGTITLTHTPLPAGSAPATGSLIGIQHFFEVFAVYENTGQPAQPSQPYTVTVQYTEAERGPAIESTLGFYFWNGSQWVREPTSTVDNANNRMTAMPNHFSTWAVLGETHRVYLPVILRN
jgi:DNA-binding beta-propeller fold protein YncE